MSNRISTILLTAYILIGIITFGHAYNHVEYDGNPFVNPAEELVTKGSLCALAWPLYWSKVAFKNGDDR